MILPSLPNDCLYDVISLLDNESLYKCLFVSRNYCEASIPIIWRNPFLNISDTQNISLIYSLVSCLNEEEISSLIAIDLINFNNQPLFEYGKFIRRFDHGECIFIVTLWLKKVLSETRIPYGDHRIRKLVDAIYHMIMRKGSNLREFVIRSSQSHFFDLPKFSTFTIYKPGITNLSSLIIYDFIMDFNKGGHQNTIEFLSMMSEFCNCIIDFELQTRPHGGALTKQILNIIKLQPLKRTSLSSEYTSIEYNDNIKKILYTLVEFRSETLKKLSIQNIEFPGVDLSFISKLKFLEQLEFIDCTGFTFKETLHLKELTLRCHCIDAVSMINLINLLCSEILHKLSLSINTSEKVKAVGVVKEIKETCLNVSFLRIEFFTEKCFDSTIPLICELLSLKILNIKLNKVDEVNQYLLIRLLCNNLMFIEDLFFDFPISSQNFEYFTNNCKVKLKRLYILFDIKCYLKKSYLVHVNNFQKTHNSLKVFGIKELLGRKFNWTDEEIEIINLLKNQGTDTIVELSEDF